MLALHPARLTACSTMMHRDVGPCRLLPRRLHRRTETAQAGDRGHHENRHLHSACAEWCSRLWEEVSALSSTRRDPLLSAVIPLMTRPLWCHAGLERCSQSPGQIEVRLLLA